MQKVKRMNKTEQSLKGQANQYRHIRSPREKREKERKRQKDHLKK
jgi:hypothetical protein